LGRRWRRQHFVQVQPHLPERRDLALSVYDKGGLRMFCTPPFYALPSRR
jgi:hypothetical protein